MSRAIALVACVSRKHDRPMPAQHLYTSAWFRKASAYVQQNADAWYIPSAKYGLVAPSTVIGPYDETLNRMPIAARRAWAARVLTDLRAVLRRGDHVLLLAGQKYRADLADLLGASFWPDEEPDP